MVDGLRPGERGLVRRDHCPRGPATVSRRPSSLADSFSHLLCLSSALLHCPPFPSATLLAPPLSAAPLRRPSPLSALLLLAAGRRAHQRSPAQASRYTSPRWPPTPSRRQSPGPIQPRGCGTPASEWQKAGVSWRFQLCGSQTCPAALAAASSFVASAGRSAGSGGLELPSAFSIHICFEFAAANNTHLPAPEAAAAATWLSTCCSNVWQAFRCLSWGGVHAAQWQRWVYRPAATRAGR